MIIELEVVHTELRASFNRRLCVGDIDITELGMLALVVLPRFPSHTGVFVSQCQSCLTMLAPTLEVCVREVVTLNLLF